MATYEELTQEQKDLLASYERTLRPLAGELARLNAKIQVLRNMYYGGVSTIISSLNTDEEVPNSSGLGGAIDVTNTQMTTVQSYLDGVFGYHTEAHQQLLIKFCGPNNMLSD